MIIAPIQGHSFRARSSIATLYAAWVASSVCPQIDGAPSQPSGRAFHPQWLAQMAFSASSCSTITSRSNRTRETFRSDASTRRSSGPVSKP